MVFHSRSSPYWLLASLFLTGCLPSSCSRNEPRSITPADSLSREYAQTFPVDTLTVLEAINPGMDELQYPRTLAYDANGLLWVTDTARHILLAFESGFVEPVERDTIPDSFPYLAGFRGKSVFAFSPATHSVYEITEGNIEREIFIGGPVPERGGLRYVTATETGFVSKVVAPEFEGYLALHDVDGEIVEQVALPGPDWRYAGLLRTRGEVVYSLSGFRPMVDRYANGSLDSLALIGFDSPMLARSLQFMNGDTHAPPLLSSSADLAGDNIFVLNMRPGWAQLDVYDLEGQLQHLVTQPAPSFNQEYYPTDIAVRQLSDGSYEIAISVVKPEPRIERYSWSPR